jgi:hypothetical protein
MLKRQGQQRFPNLSHQNNRSKVRKETIKNLERLEQHRINTFSNQEGKFHTSGCLTQ